jgi:iron complex transport system substrate-binding protein
MVKGWGVKNKPLITILIPIAFLFLMRGEVFGAVFKDSIGREVELKNPPRRIVCLAPSVTEILFYLGLGERVVGVTQFSYYPPEAAERPKVGSYIRLNAEKIIELAPDLAIGTVDGNKQDLVELLEQAGVAVYVVNPRSVREVVETVERLGLVCGVPEKGSALAAGLGKRVDRIEETAGSGKRPLVFFQINIRPIMSVSRNTIHHDIIRLAGGVNMTAESAITYPRISLEEVLARKPEVIIISSMERGGEFEKARQEWFKWPSIPAVKRGRVHLVDSDLVDRPSPRIIQGLEAVSGFIQQKSSPKSEVRSLKRKNKSRRDAEAQRKYNN